MSYYRAVRISFFSLTEQAVLLFVPVLCLVGCWFVLYLVLLVLWLVINGDALSDSGKCSLTVAQPLFRRETPWQQLQSTPGQAIKQPMNRSTDGFCF